MVFYTFCKLGNGLKATSMVEQQKQNIAFFLNILILIHRVTFIKLQNFQQKNFVLAPSAERGSKHVSSLVKQHRL